MTKYQDWYDRIIDRAQNREIPKCYTEVHHIRPRSLGGGNHPENLARLTYREHFLVHWLLTKICTSVDRRKMQRAMNAMTMPISGQRIVAGWQFEAAKRAIKDLQDDPEVHEAFMARYLAAKQARKASEEDRIRLFKEERMKKRQEIEAEILKVSSISKEEAVGLAARILKYRSRVVKVPKKYHHAKPRRDRKARPAKASRKAALEHLKSLGLRLNTPA